MLSGRCKVNILRPIKPLAYFSDLFPPQTVYAPRSTWELARTVLDEAFQLDSITGYTVAIMGDMPLVCHQNTASPLILDFFRVAGMEPASCLHTFETEEEAVGIAQHYTEDGKKLVYTYPPPPDLQTPGSLLVPLSLYGRLNDKFNLVELVDEDHQPRHHLIQTHCLNSLYDFLPGCEIYVKACHQKANGFGEDVRYCPDKTSRKAVLDWLDSRKDELSGVRMEEAVNVDECWCLSLAVMESGIRYLGAASQIFSAPARQSGSRIDPDHLPPESVIEIAKTIAQRARNMGYQGIAGFDVGMTSSGRVFVFDLNFRLVSSTPMILLHAAATNRIGARISQTWSQQCKGELAPVLERIREFAQSGTFVPLRLYEATEISGGQSVITGMVVGKTLADIETIRADMHEAIGE